MFYVDSVFEVVADFKSTVDLQFAIRSPLTPWRYSDPASLSSQPTAKEAAAEAASGPQQLAAEPRDAHLYCLVTPE